MLPKNEMFVDPGRTTAYAYFYIEDSKQTYLYNFFGMVNLDYLTEGLKHMQDLFLIALGMFEPEKVTIESVDYRDGLKNITAAKRGDLVKLSILIGVYVGCCLEKKIPYKLILAREWKGQLTKAATKARVKRITGLELTNEHIIDALGMGLSRDKELWRLKT